MLFWENDDVYLLRWIVFGMFRSQINCANIFIQQTSKYCLKLLLYSEFVRVDSTEEVTKFLSLSRVSLLKFFGKCSESVNVDANNNLQGGFIPVEGTITQVNISSFPGLICM